MADAEQRMIVCNVRFLDLFGLSADSVQPGEALADVFRGIHAMGRYDRRIVETIWLEQQSLAATRRPWRFIQEDAAGRALSVSHQPMDDGGWVATYEDISERRQAEARIRFMAHHDALTGLPNRLLFRERMETALEQIRRPSDALGVLCLDLDFFKDVNDTLGHPAGDALLEAVARRLRALRAQRRPGGPARRRRIRHPAILRRAAGRGRNAGPTDRRGPSPTIRNRRPAGDRQCQHRYRDRRGGWGQRRHPAEMRRSRAVSRQGGRPRHLSLLRGRHGRRNPGPAGDRTRPPRSACRVPSSSCSISRNSICGAAR